jgi:hypothetical protein
MTGVVLLVDQTVVFIAEVQVIFIAVYMNYVMNEMEQGQVFI